MGEHLRDAYAQRPPDPAEPVGALEHLDVAVTRPGTAAARIVVSDVRCGLVLLSLPAGGAVGLANQLFQAAARSGPGTTPGA